MSAGKGIMSSKVLSMKFMKQAEIREEEKVYEEKENKLKDLSEWKTSLSSSLQSKLKTQRKVVSVGYSSINSLKGTSTPVIGRRVFEEKPSKSSSDDTEKTIGNELGALWNQQKEELEQKSSKRNLDNSTKKANKKRKSEP